MVNFRARLILVMAVGTICASASQNTNFQARFSTAGQNSAAVSQSPTPSPTSTPVIKRPEIPSESEDSVNTRNRNSNGIEVGEPKVYDDTVLQQMLQSAEAKLAAMQVLDQGALATKLGSVTGASQQTSSVGLNIMGPSVPQTVTTANAPTGSTVTTQGQSGISTVTTNALPVSGVVSTLGQMNPPTATAPAPTTSMPSSFSVSSSSILGEQMQLTYEIANLRLLLEGSLTDRWDKSKKNVKPRVTIGFPIALAADKRYKDAVAVVEIELQNQSNTNEQLGKPAIAALLPREKTYNVAAISDKSTSIGGGVATQLLGGSVSWLRGRKTYYLVQDQDTLASVFTPASAESLGFLWQFRPVLGQRYIRSQMTQTFVQVTFDKPASTDVFGFACVRTYWRKYDRSKSILGEVIPGSLKNCTALASIPGYRLVPEANEIPLNTSHLEDQSNGQMIVNVPGSYLSGTAIRIGPAILSQGSPNFTANQQTIRFAASVSDLATKKVTMVGRDGNEIPLLMARQNCDKALNVEPADVQIHTFDQSNSLVTVRVNDPCFLDTTNPPLLFVLGARVFGYGDAPIERHKDDQNRVGYLTALVPNSVLLAAPELIVKALFQDKKYEARVALSEIIRQAETIRTQDSDFLFSQTERLVFIGQDPQTSKYEFLLYGNRLTNAVVLRPECSVAELNGAKVCVPLGRVGRDEDVDSLRRIELSAAQLNTQKYLMLQRSDERPFTIQIPSLDSKDLNTDFKPTERVTVGTDEVAISGEVKDLTRVTFNGNPVSAQKAADNKSVTLKGLNVAGITTTATTKIVVFWFNEKKAEVKIEVINSKIETVPK